MTPHKEKLEDDDRQPKVVVVGGPGDSLEWLPLKFRRSVCRHSYLAKIESSVLRDLETVTIDELDSRLIGDIQVALVDIPDDMAHLMHNRESAG